MKIDLRQFVALITEEIELRVSHYEASSHFGPGASGSAIQQIVLGFQFDQAAWVSLVFDTRPEADPVYDGEWQSYIERNTLDCDVDLWMNAYEEIAENQSQVDFIAVDGEARTIGPCRDGDEDPENGLLVQLAALFGGICRDALRDASARSVFSLLPLAHTVYLRVDEHECQYAWPDYELRGGADDTGRIQCNRNDGSSDL